MPDKPTIKIYGATVDRIEVVTGPDTWAVTVDALLALKAEVEWLTKANEELKAEVANLARRCNTFNEESIVLKAEVERLREKHACETCPTCGADLPVREDES